MSDKLTATMNRRTILKATGTIALAGLVSSGSAIAQTDLPLELDQNAEEEYVIVRNVGDEEVDITGYQINFEAGEDSNQDQIRQLAGEVVIPAGEEVWVATGALEVSGDNVVQLTEPYERPELNDEDPDVVALLDPDDNVVVSTDGSGDGSDDGDDGDGSDDGDDGDGSDDGDDGDGSDDGDDGDGSDDGDDGDGSDDGDDGDGSDDGDDGDGSDDGDSDGSDESTDDSDNDDEDKEMTDADGDGVAATDDADDDCAKVS